MSFVPSVLLEEILVPVVRFLVKKLCVPHVLGVLTESFEHLNHVSMLFFHQRSSETGKCSTKA